MKQFGDAINNTTDVVTIYDPLVLVLRFPHDVENDDDVMDIKEIVDNTRSTKQYVVPKKSNSLGTPVKIQDNTSTLKVSNIGEGIVEEDLRDMFKEFGAIQRINIPRSKGKQVRDYAFITFETRHCAQKVLDSKKRYTFNYCVLDVVWAK